MAPFPDIEGQDMDYNLRYAEDYLYVLSGEMGKTGDNGTGPSSEMSVWKGLQVNRYPVTSRGAPGSRQHTWGIDDSHNIFQKGPDKFLFMPAPSPDTSYLAVPRDPDESSFNQPRILRVKRGKSGTIRSTWENVLPISRSLDRITLFHGIATGKKGLLIVRGGIAGSSGDVQNVHLSLHPFTANGTVPWTWYHHRYRVPSWRTLPYSRSENPFSLQIPFIGGPFPGSFQLNGHLFGRSPERSDS